MARSEDFYFLFKLNTTLLPSNLFDYSIHPYRKIQVGGRGGLGGFLKKRDKKKKKSNFVNIIRRNSSL